MRPKHAANIASRELPDGEMMILGSDGSKAMVLNQIATAVWHLADGSRSADEIAAFISQSFPETSPSQVKVDVLALITQLADVGIIEDF